MTDQDAMKLAAEIWNAGSSFPIPSSDDVLRFAKLVAEAEREACAKVCYEAKANIWEFHPYEVREAANSVCVNLAATIRARGQE